MDNVTGTEGQRELKIMLTLAEKRGFAPASVSNVRMERVNRIRNAIVEGHYFVRSADLAEKFLGVMREDPGPRSSQSAERSHRTRSDGGFLPPD